MTISGGPAQLPVVILPHEETSKFEFEKSRRFDLSATALLAIATLGGGILVGTMLLWTSYWLLGPFLIIGCIFVFLRSRG